MAGSCSRKLGFEMLGDVAETEPIADNTLVAFHTGTHLHELLQEAMIKEWGMQVEVECDLRPLGYDISGHADGVYSDVIGYVGIETICWELKTKTAFGFNLARKSFEPEVHEVAQASMYAWALNADAVHLVYLAKDSQYGRNPVRAGETVEWVLPMDEPVPGDGRTPRQIAGAEATRIDAIATEIRSGFIPERFIPGVGEEALAVLDRGDFFGEMALIDNEPRSADAKAHETDATVLSIDRATLNEILSMDPHASLQFLNLLCRMISRRLREINDKIVQWKYMSGGF